jgi:FG-GAP-like repeat
MNPLIQFRKSIALTLIGFSLASLTLSAQSVVSSTDGAGGALPNVAKRYDFNRDGYPDYVILKPTSDQSSPLLDFPPLQTNIWYLQNFRRVAARLGPIISSKWVLADAADFNRDGYPDYALFNIETGQTKIKYLRDNVEIDQRPGPTAPAGWKLQKVGDFNGDGKPDYVLVNSSTRQTAIWYMNNNQIIPGEQHFGPTLPSGFELKAVADFDLDGLDDYLLFTLASPRRTQIWYIVRRNRVRQADGPTVLPGWLLRGAADFNQDGHPDYLLYNQQSKQTQIWYLDGSVHLIGQAFGPTIPSEWFPCLPSGI